MRTGMTGAMGTLSTRDPPGEGKSGQYLLIETGHEGIDQLCHLSESSAVILEKRKEFIAKKLALEKDLWKNERDELREKMMPSAQDVADFFCVQQWDGEEFRCVCARLGVAPSKRMIH